MYASTACASAKEGFAAIAPLAYARPFATASGDHCPVACHALRTRSPSACSLMVLCCPVVCAVSGSIELTCATNRYPRFRTVSMYFGLLTVPEDLAQCGDIKGQVVFFDNRIRPNLIQDVPLVDNVSRVLHQNSQNVPGFRRDRDTNTSHF